MSAKRLGILALLITMVVVFCSCGGPKAPSLSSVTIQAPSQSVVLGRTLQLSAVGTYSDQTSKTLTACTWSSSNTAVATISNGLITSASQGTTTITATSGSVSTTMTITVMPPVLQSLSISPASPSVVEGLTVTLTATGTMSDGTAAPAATLANVAWSSSNTTTATAPTGTAAVAVINGVKAGQATITVSVGSVTTSTGIQVNTPSVTSIDVAPAVQQIAVGSTHQFTATAHWNNNTTSNVTALATWQSGDGNKVSVAAGLATGVAPGDGITISAQYGGKTGTATVTIIGAPVLQSLSISPTNASVVMGLSASFTVTGTLSDGSAAPAELLADITWSSSDPKKANVPSEVTGPNAEVQGMTPGHVTITASAGSVTVSTGLDVVGPTITHIEVAPSGQTISVGATYQFSAIAHYNNNSTAEVTSQATWQSNDASKVETGHSGTAGLVYGVAATGGTDVTISATLEGQTGTATVAVVAPITLNYGGFVYAMAQNSTDNSLHIFTVQNDGTLNILMNVSPLNIQISSYQKQVRLVMHPSKEFLAILYRPTTCSSGANGFVGLYRINTASGVPYRVQGSPFALENACPTQLNFSSDGKRLYIADGSGHTAQECTTIACESVIKTYAFNAYSGTIGGAQSSITMPGRDVKHIAFTPDSKYAYAVGSDSGGEGSNVLYAYSVDSTTGALTQVSGSPFGPYKYGQYAVVDPTGTRLFVQDAYSAQFLYYNIAPDTGALSSFGSMQNTGSKMMMFDPVNQWMYASVWRGIDATISSYQYNASTGSLTYKKAYSETSEWPVTLAVHDLGGILYSGTSNGKLNVYAVDPTSGDVSKLQSNLLWGTSSDPDVVYVPKVADDGFLFAFSDYNPLPAFSINTTGAMTGIGSYSVADPDSYTPEFAVNNALGHMFVSYRKGLPSRMASFRIDRNTGTVTKTGVINYLTNVTKIAAHPSGKFVYVTQSGENSEAFIEKVDINPATAEFISGSTRLITMPHTLLDFLTDDGMIFNSSGTSLYLITRDYDPESSGPPVYRLRRFTVDLETGALAQAQDLPSTKRLWYPMTFDSSGKFLYVSAFEYETYYDSIEIYSVAPDGSLTFSGSHRNGRYQPPDRFRSANGYLFIGWSDYGGGIKVYSIDSATGVPTQVAVSTAANFPDFVVNDDGSRVYALGYDNPNWWSAFQTYRVDLTAGTLTKTMSVNLSPTGTYRGMAYVKKP